MNCLDMIDQIDLLRKIEFYLIDLYKCLFFIKSFKFFLQDVKLTEIILIQMSI